MPFTSFNMLQWTRWQDPELIYDNVFHLAIVTKNDDKFHCYRMKYNGHAIEKCNQSCKQYQQERRWNMQITCMSIKHLYIKQPKYSCLILNIGQVDQKITMNARNE